MEDRDRLRAAETVALRLGELIEDLFEDLRALPRWRPSPFKVRELTRAVEVGLVMFNAWRDAFAP